MLFIQKRNNLLVAIYALLVAGIFGCSTLWKEDITTNNSSDIIFHDNLSFPTDIHSGNVIWSLKSASEWAEGYPVGNGRIGGMVTGNALRERIALNHDLLWRKYWTYQKRNTAIDIETIREYNLKGLWDKGDDLALKKIPFTGNAIYINPYVPAGDLYIDMRHKSDSITGYRRLLDMEKGIVEISYDIDDVSFRRETFSSWKSGVLATHITTSDAGTLTGEVSLSRLLDPECIVTGYSDKDQVVLEGSFEEGREFAIVAKLFQRGGRITGGRKVLTHDVKDMPGKDFGLKYVFSTNEMYGKGDGASIYFDTADEVWILVAITVDDEVGKENDLVAACLEKIANVPPEFDAFKVEHIADFKRIYNRLSLQLGEKKDSLSTDSLIRKSINEESAPPVLIEKVINLSRYLAISSGRPQPSGSPAKAPINLQGIWNQDQRPAWDCDYHLDLNLEMCYWSLDILNLGDLMIPLMDWAERLQEGARVAARDMYGCNGVAFGIVADNMNIGNVDNVAFFWTGGAAWIAQVLWLHWEYSGDKDFLSKRLYPFLKEIGRFYEDFLVHDKNGNLVPALSMSPEMGIAGRKRMSFSSSASTNDLELIRDIFTHLITAGKLLNESSNNIQKWENILDKVPLPTIGADGSLNEWLEEHAVHDLGHRHRSLLVGLSPGERITVEHTPQYAEAAYKAITKRNKYGRKSTASFTFVWDAQMLARLYRGEEAYDQFRRMIPVHVLDNLLLTTNDWSGRKGGLAWFKDIKLFQIEANIQAGVAIIEMIFQDRSELMKFLPALPAELGKGKVSGLKARGGFEVSLEWDNGAMISADVTSLAGNICRIKKAGFNELKIYSGGKEISYQAEGEIIAFDTLKGGNYHLVFQ